MATAAPLPPPTPTAMRKVIVVAIIPKTLGNFENQEMVGFAYLNETWQNFFVRYKIPVGRDHIVCSQERGPNGWEVQMNTVVKFFIDKYSMGKCPYTVRLRTSRALNPVNNPIPIGTVPNMYLASPEWSMSMLETMGILGLQQPTFTQNRVSEARGSPDESQDNSVPDEAIDLSRVLVELVSGRRKSKLSS